MSRLILFAGSFAANIRSGGLAWERLSWILGLKRLGFDVVAVDQLDEARCVNAPGDPRGYAGCLNVPWAAALAERFELGSGFAIVGEHGEALHGPSLDELLDLASEAEMLVNLAGNLRLEELKRRARLRVLVDVDPGFTQLWLASGRPAPRVEAHDLYFTIGENVGTPASPLPTGPIQWRHTRQPVLLDAWPFAERGDTGRLTAIAGWRGGGPHGALARIGHEFPDKADALLELADLPSNVPQRLEAVLRMKRPEDDALRRLREGGWEISDPDIVAEPETFRAFVQESGGEISVAKGAYVQTRGGWFSDRTTRYLASGRPAIVQDTGFGTYLPVGEGLLAFSTPAEAAAAAQAVAEDYNRHRRAARQIAEEHFASDLVLGRFVEEVLAAA